MTDFDFKVQGTRIGARQLIRPLLVLVLPILVAILAHFALRSEQSEARPPAEAYAVPVVEAEPLSISFLNDSLRSWVDQPFMLEGTVVRPENKRMFIKVVDSHGEPMSFGTIADARDEVGFHYEPAVVGKALSSGDLVRVTGTVRRVRIAPGTTTVLAVVASNVQVLSGGSGEVASAQ